MDLYLKAIPGESGYSAKIFSKGSKSLIDESPYAMTEAIPGLYFTTLNIPVGEYIAMFDHNSADLGVAEPLTIMANGDGNDGIPNIPSVSDKPRTDLFGNLIT